MPGLSRNAYLLARRGEGVMGLGFEECVGVLWRDHLPSALPGQAAGTDLSNTDLSLPHCEMST